MTKFCPECGQELVDRAKFCKSCGASISDAKSYGRDGEGEVEVVERDYSNILLIIGIIASVLIPLLGFIIGVFMIVTSTRFKSKPKGIALIAFAVLYGFASIFLSHFLYL